MGQKQSYSLNPDFDNKEAVQGEVAQTFNTAEPTPVSLRPVTSVRSHTKVDQVAKELVEPIPSLEVKPVDQPVHLEKLEMDPELPHCIFVLDKENADPKSEENTEIQILVQKDGLLERKLELCELPGFMEPIKVSESIESTQQAAKPIDYEKLECGLYELVEQPLDIKPTIPLDNSSDLSISDVVQQILPCSNPLYLSRTLEFNEQ